jgi:RHS repeat-associated protein
MFPFCGRILFGLVLIISTLSGANAQNSNDKGAPAESKPGQSATSTYARDKIETLNLANGNFSLSIPLATVGGRGSVAYPIALSYNSKVWSAQQDLDPYFIGPGVVGTPIKHASAIYDKPTEYEPGLAKLGGGWSIRLAPGINARTYGFDSALVSHLCNHYTNDIQDCGFKYTLTKMWLSLPDGSQVELRDTLTQGAPSRTTVVDGDGFHELIDRDRGRVWRTNDQNTTATSWYQQYDYDSLNRLRQVHEYTATQSLDWQQEYVYDPYGNRSLSQSGTTQNIGINSMQAAVVPNTTTNRIYGPGETEQSHPLIAYDDAGNQTKDWYTGTGERVYDAENRMVGAQDNAGGWSYYVYDGDGRRVRVKQSTAGASAGAQQWQVYGIDGALVAEYNRTQGGRGSLLNLAGEYGYRNGQLLVKATVGASMMPNGGGGFETPVVGDGNYQNNPAGAWWDFAGATGISGNGSALTGGNANAPEGNQVAFIQGGSASVISQTVNGLTVGATYAVTFSSAQRGNCCGAGGEDFRVFVDDAFLGSVLVGTFRPGSATYQDYATIVFTPQAGNTLKLRFVGLNSSGGDNTALIDNVRITVVDNVEWLLTDQLGTPRMVFDKSGALANVKRHDYLPFGEELLGGTGGRTSAQGYDAADGVRQKFTSKERDNETGLDYFLARYYASMQGRFTSADPFGGSGFVSVPQSWNKYAYCLNRPFVFTDPSGQIWLTTDNQNFMWVDDDEYKRNQKQFKDYSVANGAITNYQSSTNCSQCANVSQGQWVQLNGDGSVTGVPNPTTFIYAEYTDEEISNPVPVIAGSVIFKDLEGGPPNGKWIFPNKGGGRTERLLDNNGRAYGDIDYGHDHGAGDPHVHWWDWTGDRPKRGEGEPVPEGFDFLVDDGGSLVVVLRAGRQSNSPMAPLFMPTNIPFRVGVPFSSPVFLRPVLVP